MDSILIGYLSAALYAAVSFIIAVIIFKVSKDNEYSRKTIHILCGFGWVILKIFFERTIHPLLISFGLLVIIVVFHYKKVRLIEREEQDMGTVIYGSSVVGMALLSYIFPAFFDSFGIGFIGMAVGDGMAAVAGKIFHKSPVIYRNKTIAGTVSCILFSFVAFWSLSMVFDFPLNLLQIAILSFIAGVTELFGGKADNVIMPFSLFIVSNIMMCG